MSTKIFKILLALISSESESLEVIMKIVIKLFQDCGLFGHLPILIVGCFSIY